MPNPTDHPRIAQDPEMENRCRTMVAHATPTGARSANSTEFTREASTPAKETRRASTSENQTRSAYGSATGSEVPVAGVVVWAVLGAGLLTALAGSWPAPVAASIHIGDSHFLAGDDEIVPSPDNQDRARVAAGGPGFFVVWQDLRTVLAPFVDDENPPLNGNMADVYGTRLDQNGDPIDEAPVLVANWGRNQTNSGLAHEGPDAAWNGESWLVVFRGERPEWRFFVDVYGVRISEDGEVLDPEPGILLRPYVSGSDVANWVRVTSVGSTWYVVLEEFRDTGESTERVASVVRVGADGTRIDPEPIVLASGSTQPGRPMLSWNGSEFLLVYASLATYGDAYIQRFDVDLQPIDAPQRISSTQLAYFDVNSNGDGWLIVARAGRSYRVDAAGAVLDPDGIDPGFPYPYVDRGAVAGWDGSHWLVFNTAYVGADPRIHVARMTSGGTVLSVNPIDPVVGDITQMSPAVANDPAGGVVAAFTERFDPPNEHNVHAGRLAPGETSTDANAISVGLPRQSRLQFATDEPGAAHLAVYRSETGFEDRAVAQLVDGEGVPLAPHVVVAAGPFVDNPQVAFNGDVYLAAWQAPGGLYGRRLAADGSLLDAAETFLVSGGGPGVAALGSTAGADFYLVYTEAQGTPHIVYAFGQRLDAETLAPVGSPQFLGGNFATDPSARTFGSGAIAAWERQATHDNTSSEIKGAIVDANGAVVFSGTIDVSGQGDDPTIAVGSDRALITWYDNSDFQNWRVEGRIVAADGTFPTNELVIGEAENLQWASAAGWNGEQFLVAWADYRSIQGLEQRRGDIYVGRVGQNGQILDPAGIQLTEGPLPENLPAVAALDGTFLIGWSQLGAGVPEVQRIALTTARELAPTDAPGPGNVHARVLSIFPEPFASRTELRLALPDGAEVELLVLDVAGRKVTRLFHGSLPAGVHDWSWDGRRDDGRQVPAGVYRVRALVNGAAHDRRMTLLR